MHRGWFKIWRKFFDNDKFWKKKPICPAAAWIWLVGHASAIDRDYSIGYKSFPIKRGELIVSGRYLAKAWGWSLAKVQRYIDFLGTGQKPELKVSHISYRSLTHITIINYGLYQAEYGKSESVNESQNESVASQSRVKTKNVKECKRSKNLPSDPRVARLFNFWCYVFKITFGVEYDAKFGRDQKIIKNKLGYAEKCTSYPEGQQELAIAYVMDEFLEKQKGANEQYRKHTLPGWDKDFTKINATVVWANVDWLALGKEYERIQQEKKEIGKRD